MPTQFRRLQHSGAGLSPALRVFGLWNDKDVLVSYEAVLFERVSGQNRLLTSDQIKSMGGAICETPAGATVGTISFFDHPILTPPPISPVIRVSPALGLNFDKWNSAQALPVASIVTNLAVKVFGTTKTGTITFPVATRPYLGGSIFPTDVNAAVVHFTSDLSGFEGAALVVEPTGELVGMLFNVQANGGASDAYCYPAELFH
jgi:hypothetical protein